ncbi:hydroxyacid dehydrogenase [Microbacterium aurantiacum]|uniref:hydroxyacid dehydrogenase n=1 Tax=Microbacterium aurantiacum TaxID=162393 RepID=UPI0006AD3617|nr:hydroxyacid dehydrogenase [Microbacterium chocolatum]ANG84845.1 hypothetical protein A8L33_05105 [Microbacterium chocolatum]
MTGARERVVLLEPIHEDGRALLGRHHEVIDLQGSADPRLAEALASAQGLVVRSTPVGADMLALAPGLRVLGRHGAGLDNIDLDAAAARGIRVVNTPRSNTESVAEYVIAVMFSLLKRLDETREALRRGAFLASNGSLPGQVDRLGLVGRELSGLRLGLVGAGAIGQAVARRATGLGMTVAAYDPYVPAEALQALGMVPRTSLDALVAGSDVVSLHVPGSPQNRGLISARELALMPAGAILVNAARGGLVDHEALIQAVRSGALGGAAVDVFDPEPPAAEDPILHTVGIIATPHMAAMTAEALRRMSVDVATAVASGLAADPA